MFVIFIAIVLINSFNLCCGISPVTTFTTCGATGSSGPTQIECSNAYNDMEHEEVFSLLTINGMQIISIPFPGIYRFVLNFIDLFENI